MHYRDIQITNKAFYAIEPRAVFYDNYLKQKDAKQWTESVTREEAEKLLRFITSWDHHFIGEIETFQHIYSDISPDLDFLKDKSIESVDLDNPQVEKSISHIFDKVADGLCYKHQSTDASKILHTILPNLMVMWDRKIREGILKDVNKDWGTAYVWEFLSKMQKEAREAIASCAQEKELSSADAKRTIEETCRGHSLAKLIDQHNYVIFTKTENFKEVLEWTLKNRKITELEQQRLLSKLP